MSYKKNLEQLGSYFEKRFWTNEFPLQQITEQTVEI